MTTTFEPAAKKAKTGLNLDDFGNLDPERRERLFNESNKSDDKLFVLMKDYFGDGIERNAAIYSWKSYVQDATSKIADHLNGHFSNDDSNQLEKLAALSPQFLIGSLSRLPALKDHSDDWCILEGWRKFRSKKASKTVAEVIKDLSMDQNERKYGIQRISVRLIDDKDDTYGDATYAYYVASGPSTLNFRHEGRSGNSPSELFLQDLSTKEGRTLVHYSASGSGKTSELAGASVSRKCHLAVAIAPRDGMFKEYVEDKDFDSIYTEEPDNARRNCSEIMNLGSELEAIIVQRYPETFSRLLTAATQTDKLRLVIAVDEASQCPGLTRSIISDSASAKEAVYDLFCELPDVEVDFAHVRKIVDVMFSVAGTGVSAATAGSLPTAYDVVQPTFAAAHARLSKRLLKGVGNHLVPGGGAEKKNLSECIDQHLPVVAVMMENGRMASICCNLMKQHPSDIPIVESVLVETIANSFIKSNGLSNLLNDPLRQQRVAATALAVHLFQGREENQFPEEIRKYEESVSKMDFAIQCAPWCEEVKQVVTRYGLLEPNTDHEKQKWEPGQPINRPFLMTNSQQIIALYMLGVGLENMFEASPFGFETLSTHLIKCALSASLATSEKARPSLHETLEMIGFRMCDNSTDPEIVNEWNGLRDLIAVASTRRSEQNEDTALFRNTRQVQAELLIESRVIQGKARTEVLIIDKLLHHALDGLTAGDDNDFTSPISCVNYGNSPFADGFITFYVRKVNPKTPQETYKFTIMNQSKDYHTSSLNLKKLQKHAEIGQHKLLNPLFGEKRLLCVSSSERVLMGSARSEKVRKFFPYCVDKSFILKDLFETLTNQRNEAERLQKYSYSCDGTGKPISEGASL